MSVNVKYPARSITSTVVLACVIVLLFGSKMGHTEDPAINIDRDVVYGHKAGMALVYDVLTPADQNGATIMFMVSGGWFSGWRPPESRIPWFSYLLSEGFTVVPVHHGSAPRFKVPDAVADVRRAVRHIKMNADQFNIDPSRIGVMGGSAGGHLSLMLGLASDEGDASAADPVLQNSNRVRAVVAYFPPVDLRRIVGPSDNFPALDFESTLAESVSPIAFVSKDDPPVLLVHGDQDELVPISNSEIMAKALSDVGVYNKFVTIEGAAHGFRAPEHREQAQSAVVAFFKTQLLTAAE